MKILLVFAGLTYVSCYVPVCASTSVLEDNSHYVEGKSRYVWMSGGRNLKHVLVDLEEPVDETLLKTRDGANNEYWLFTRENPTNAQVIINGNASTIWNSNYNAGRPLNVLVHGWIDSGNAVMNPLIRSAFLEVQDANVLVVDWNTVANLPYTTSVAGVPNVGQHVGNFLAWLINTAGGDWNNVHLVGYSLGAHVIASAGRATKNRPARVTGLDPAGVGWTSNPSALRPDAGQYVEAIHTDGKLVGIFDPVGHADFYPNGGINPQPGCTVSACSHGRAFELFASSVRTNHFIGRQCNNLLEAELSYCWGEVLNMGNGNITKRGSGIYGLRTENSWPY